jgi:hypothetical protein
MRLGVGVAVAIALTLMLVACGSSGPTAAEKKEAAERRAKAHALAVAKKCNGQLGDFLSSLNELDSRLTIGLNYNDYLNEVGDVTVVYGEIPINQLDAPCLGAVGVASEKALRKYTDAAEVWQDCFSEFSCENDSIDPELQVDWSAASGLLAQAQSGMAQLRQP